MLRIGILFTIFTSLGGAPDRHSAVLQSVPVPEVSGAVNIGGDRVLLIGDEGYQVQLVSQASTTFQSAAFKDHLKPVDPTMNGGEETKKTIDDIEDIAWDQQRQAAFLITSHSRSKKQDVIPDPVQDKPQRHKLARLTLRPGSLHPTRSSGCWKRRSSAFPLPSRP